MMYHCFVMEARLVLEEPEDRVETPREADVDDPEKEGEDEDRDDDHGRRPLHLLGGRPGGALELRLDLFQEIDRLLECVLEPVHVRSPRCITTSGTSRSPRPDAKAARR